MPIDANKVHAAVLDCLYRDEEVNDGKLPTDTVYVDGIMNKWGFHPSRLESHRTEVAGWLASLPPEFHENGGGGMSFLNACMDDEGHQWGEHRNMDELFSLGIGLGLAKCCLPREMWGILPGGMPYYSVKCAV